MARKPNYSLPLNSGRATKRTHDAEVNRVLGALYDHTDETWADTRERIDRVEGETKDSLSELWDAAVFSQIGGPAQSALLNEFRAMRDQIIAHYDQLPLVVLALGQSNMRSTPEQTGGDLTVNPSVFAWNSQVSPAANGTAWVVATPGQNPFIGTVANNLAFQFCKELQVSTGRQVYLILVAAGGHHIEAFMNSVDVANNGWSQTPGELDLFTFAMNQMNTSLPLVPGAPTSVDYMIWHQGEANREDQVEIYARKLRTILKRLELNGRIARNKTTVIAGELLVGATNGRFRVRHASSLKRLQMGTREDAFPRVKIASSVGLQPVSLIDDLHFSGEDLTALGKRYADAAFSEQAPAELDPVSCDLTVDGGLGWATNFVAAQTHTTYARREPVYLADTPLTIEDNDHLGWCYVAPDHTATNLPARKIYRVDPYAQFLMSIEARNDHPTADGSFSLAVYEYNKDMAYIGINVMTLQTIAPETTVRHSVAFGHSDNGRTNNRDFASGAKFFSPVWRFTPDGVGPAIRFNIPNPRWI